MQPLISAVMQLQQPQIHAPTVNQSPFAAETAIWQESPCEIMSIAIPFVGSLPCAGAPMGKKAFHDLLSIPIPKWADKRFIGVSMTVTRLINAGNLFTCQFGHADSYASEIRSDHLSSR